MPIAVCCEVRKVFTRAPSPQTTTSATLGSEADYPALVDFGSTLFDEVFEESDIVGPKHLPLAVSELIVWVIFPPAYVMQNGL